MAALPRTDSFLIRLNEKRKEPVFSKCLVLTSNALLFQVGALVVAAGVFLMKSDWSDLDSDTVDNAITATLVLGALFVSIGSLGCCTLTCRLRRGEYLFLLIILITTAATAFSITQIDIIAEDLKTDPYPSASEACTAELTQAETDFQENFNDLYVNFQDNNEKYQWFYDWYGDNCAADIGNGACSCEATLDAVGDSSTECASFKDDVCACCDAYVCCKQNINMFMIDKLGLLKFGFYGFAGVQAVIIIFTFYHIWNTATPDDHLDSRESTLRESRPNMGIDLRDSQFADRRTSEHDREVLRRASQSGRMTRQSIEMSNRGEF